MIFRVLLLSFHCWVVCANHCLGGHWRFEFENEIHKIRYSSYFPLSLSPKMTSNKRLERMGPLSSLSFSYEIANCWSPSKCYGTGFISQHLPVLCTSSYSKEGEAWAQLRKLEGWKKALRDVLRAEEVLPYNIRRCMKEVQPSKGHRGAYRKFS